MTTRVKFNYHDYLLFPADGNRHEIIDGEHYMTPAPNIKHQRISRNLEWVFQKFLREHPVGEIFDAPCDVVFSGYDIVEPDLVYVAAENKKIITEKNIQGAPDLVVEILSPGTTETDLDLKKKLYEKNQVKEYWVADPDAETVLVFLLEDGLYREAACLTRNEVLSTGLVPGMEIPLREVFTE